MMKPMNLNKQKIPDRPFFIPNIPDDILDPFINPDVDK